MGVEPAFEVGRQITTDYRHTPRAQELAFEAGFVASHPGPGAGVRIGEQNPELGAGAVEAGGERVEQRQAVMGGVVGEDGDTLSAQQLGVGAVGRRPATVGRDGGQQRSHRVDGPVAVEHRFLGARALARPGPGPVVEQDALRAPGDRRGGTGRVGAGREDDRPLRRGGRHGVEVDPVAETVGLGEPFELRPGGTVPVDREPRPGREAREQVDQQVEALAVLDRRRAAGDLVTLAGRWQSRKGAQPTEAGWCS